MRATKMDKIGGQVQREKYILRRVYLSKTEVWENRNITMIDIYGEMNENDVNSSQPGWNSCPED